MVVVIIPNFAKVQVVHSGSAETHTQPFVRWASANNASRLSIMEFIL